MTGFYSEGKAEDVTVKWLIDTGCTITILSKAKFDEITEGNRPTLNEYKKVLVTATDSPVQVFGQTTFNIKLGGQWVRHQVLVADVTNEGLIGLDFLMNNSVTLDFASRRVTCLGENLEAQCNRNLDRICRVTVAETVMIPAGTRKIIRGRTAKPWQKEPGWWNQLRWITGKDLPC